MFNVAVIGLGMGRAHLEAYRDLPDVRILGIADIDEGRLADQAEAFSIPQTFTDYRDLLAVPEVDLVSVCLPNFLHAPVAIDALQAGKHVLVEKPMARTLAEAEEMKAAAEKHHKTLAISMNYRWGFSPKSMFLKYLIDRGDLGDIYYVRTVSLRRRSFPRNPTVWFCDKQRSGGGGLIDMGPHMLDLAMWLARDYEPVRVSGVTRTAIMKETDVDDFSAGMVRMKNGATIQIESTWATYTRPAMHITVFGTEGGAILDPGAADGQTLTLISPDGDSMIESSPVDIQLPNPKERTVQEHVVNAIRNGRTPDNSAACGLAVMRIIDGIMYRSSESGQEVIVGGK